jgi:hypothetical protein
VTVHSSKLGPGSLIFGADPDNSDWSCQLSACKVVPDKDQDDPVIMLCGDTKAGATTYTATLEGTLDQDLDQAAGVVYWTWLHKGEQFPVVFIPNDTSINSVSGTVTVDPVQIGGDEGGKDMTSDFTFDFVGFPTLAAVPVVP